MSASPILLLHICSGTLGLLSGAAAIIFRKGSQRHRLTGDVFVVSMVGLGASGAYLGLMKGQIANVAMGILTCYLVGTAWMTARRRDGEVGLFEWAALTVPLTLGGVLLGFAVQATTSPAGLRFGLPAGPYLFFALVALLFATGDARMISRGGVAGTQRLVRHLWRMCLALFIASGSLFLARPHLFPQLLRRTHLLFVLGILPLALMIFWLFRVRLKKSHKSRKPLPLGTAAAFSVR